MKFSMRYALSPHELWAPEAATKLEGTRTVVTWQGQRVQATIRSATLSDDRHAILIQLETDEDLPDLAIKLDVDDLRDPCTRKIAFDTEDLVKTELARIIKRSMLGERTREEHIETGYYQCPFGEHWHLSSRPWDDHVNGRKPRRRR